MSEKITNELMYEVLKQLQGDMASVKETLADHTRLLLRLREDINELRGDDLRMEGSLAQMQIRLERIEKRLNLVDA